MQRASSGCRGAMRLQQVRESVLAYLFRNVGGLCTYLLTYCTVSILALPCPALPCLVLPVLPALPAALNTSSTVVLRKERRAMDRGRIWLTYPQLPPAGLFAVPPSTDCMVPHCHLIMTLHPPTATFHFRVACALLRHSRSLFSYPSLDSLPCGLNSSSSSSPSSATAYFFSLLEAVVSIAGSATPRRQAFDMDPAIRSQNASSPAHYFYKYPLPARTSPASETLTEHNWVSNARASQDTHTPVLSWYDSD